MFFFNTKNRAAKDFEKIYSRLSPIKKKEVDLIVLIADYFVYQLDRLFFSELKRVSKKNSLSSEIEDLVYTTLIYGMSYEGITNVTRLQSVLFTIVLNRNIEEATEFNQKNLIPLKLDDIDKDGDTSFLQLMTRIFEKWNEEYSEEKYKEYIKLSDIFCGFVTVFIPGTLKGMRNMSLVEMQKKAKQIRQKFKSSQFVLLKMMEIL
jgi:hypothetical protein